MLSAKRTYEILFSGGYANWIRLYGYQTAIRLNGSTASAFAAVPGGGKPTQIAPGPEGSAAYLRYYRCGRPIVRNTNVVLRSSY
jgi:hypothetical protein